MERTHVVDLDHIDQVTLNDNPLAGRMVDELKKTIGRPNRTSVLKNSDLHPRVAIQEEWWW